MKHKVVTFSINCEMSERWVPYFLGMLQLQQRLGSMGSSRAVALYSDGDGDYRPKFSWKENFKVQESPLKEEDISCFFFDAG